MSLINFAALATGIAFTVLGYVAPGAVPVPSMIGVMMIYMSVDGLTRKI